MVLREHSNDATVKGLTLHHLLEKGVQETMLLQVQSSVFHVWMDLVQKSEDAEKFISIIPDFLWKPDMLRTS